MNEENKNWSEINKDISKVINKVKTKIDEEALVEDLKDSLKETLDNTSEIFNSLLNDIISAVKDEEIRKESKEIISNLYNEFKKSTKDIQGENFTNYTEEINFQEEE